MTTPLPCALAAPVCAALCAWSALAAAVPAHAAERAPVTVFVASLQARGDVSADHAALLTGALVREVATLPGRTVVTTRDIEQVLSQERLRQLLDCDSTNCALEMAGQVNAEELVFGDLGRLGATWILSLTRVRARDATALARVTARWSEQDPAWILHRIPSLVRELFHQEESRVPRAVPWLAAGAGAVVAGTGALLAGTGLLLGTLGVLVVVQDVAGGGRPFTGPHVVTATQGMLANAALGSGGLLGVLAVALVTTGVALLVTSPVLHRVLQD